ncbi:MAG TPA: hypothetical protein VHI52_03695 [Verrucomicrobiae bacterium]|jgi:hypothetical protein|nr:hypothetical protein [Verrucomicrobiae bacterium]
MRSLVVISLSALFLVGCDPGGLRRVRVRLPQFTSDNSIKVHQQEVQEALRLLEAVVEPLGFRDAPGQSTNSYLRVYVLSRPPVIVDGRSYSRDVPIRASQTPTGIEVAFGNFGFLGSTPEPAVRAFKEARAAFVSKFGSKNVKTKTFGSANPSPERTGASFSSRDDSAWLWLLAQAADADRSP